MDRRLITYLGLLGLLALLCWSFPLFHIRPIGGGEESDHRPSPTSIGFNPDGISRSLESYSRKAIEYATLCEAFDVDATKAKDQFGKQSGLGGAHYFCVRGEGTVELSERDCVFLTMGPSPRRVCLELGAVAGNVVRDAVGIKASEFTNSQEFNAVSIELNRQVEASILEPNRGLLKSGARIVFVGCGRIGGKSDLDTLRLVPIQLKVSQ